MRVAVLGAGRWGPGLIRAFHDHPASEVAWVVDRDEGRLAEARSRFPEVRVAAAPEAALDDDAAEAVVVATPTTTHYRLARAALERGKHVLVEKPLATRVEHAEELCRLAEERRLVLMVGHVFLYNPAVRKVKELLDDGRLGRLFYLSMVRTNLGPIRTDVNAAWDLAAHDLAIAHYWLGAPPTGAAAWGGSWINGGIEDAVFATLRYPAGVVANLHASWLSPRKVRDVTVVGERAMLTFDDMNLAAPLRLYDQGVSGEAGAPGFVDTFAGFRTSIREGEVVVPEVPPGEPLKAECDEFLACVAGGLRPLSDGPRGLAAVRALAAIERSLARGGAEEPV